MAPLRHCEPPGDLMGFAEGPMGINVSITWGSTCKVRVWVSTGDSPGGHPPPPTCGGDRESGIDDRLNRLGTPLGIHDGNVRSCRGHMGIAMGTLRGSGITWGSNGDRTNITRGSRGITDEPFGGLTRLQLATCHASGGSSSK